MNKKYIQKLIAVFSFSLIAISLFAPISLFAAARDCDSNAIIYCGTISKTELKNKLSNGTGKRYQSSKQLQALFSKYGFKTSDISKLKEGRVTKTNKVYVGSKRVASNVYTMGRHNISGSTRVSGISYPVYRRHPSVSFISSSIDAYVYLNYDGSMAYAILKSCGNIVIGVGRRERPAANPEPEPQPGPTLSITIQKFNDLNNNGLREANESFLGDWAFRVRGGTTDRTVLTNSNGQAVITNLAPANYIVTEIQREGWANSTDLSIVRDVTTDPATQLFMFGNYQLAEDDGEEPPIPGGGDTPGPTQMTLPVSGMKENIAIAVAIILSLCAVLYFASRAYLRMLMKGERPPTDPRKMVKELRKRATAKRKKIQKSHNKIIKSESKYEKNKKRFKKEHGL